METITFPDIQRMRREGMPAPVAYLVYGRQDCECHGEPMGWNKDKQYKAGGRWRCAVKDRKQQREQYRNDAEFRKRKKEWNREYTQTRRQQRPPGFCSVCVVRYATRGSTRCDSCRDYDRRWTDRTSRKERIQAKERELATMMENHE